jgi:hypothetical protein
MSKVRTIYSLHVALCREASAEVYAVSGNYAPYVKSIEGFADGDANQK